MTPGQHTTEPLLPKRSLGRLRDTILIILPGPKILPIALHRADLDHTVVETCLKHGHGGINIDACRIRHASPEDFEHHKSMVDRLKTQGGSLAQSWCNSSDLSGASEVQSAGRWPPNVLLVHGPECRQVGTHKIRSSAFTPSKPIPAPAFGSATGITYGFKCGAERSDVVSPSHANPDGTEEIPNWNCQPNCPVRLLDEMSDQRPGSIGALRDPNGNLGYHGGVARGAGAAKTGTPDFGSASRYFPQFESLDQAMAWLNTLIGQS